MPTETDSQYPNLVTIVGRGVPSNYEITVNGEIELVDRDPAEAGIVVTNHAVEGVIETGVTRFRFSGEMANVHTIDWNGVPASESPNTPEVHIDYSVPDRRDV